MDCIDFVKNVCHLFRNTRIYTLCTGVPLSYFILVAHSLVFRSRNFVRFYFHFKRDGFMVFVFGFYCFVVDALFHSNRRAKPASPTIYRRCMGALVITNIRKSEEHFLVKFDNHELCSVSALYYFSYLFRLWIGTVLSLIP